MEGQIEPITVIATELNKLPSIGKKSALRLAYHLAGLPVETVQMFAENILESRKAIRYCRVCGTYAMEDLCPICADSRRHNGQICVVRDPKDVASMERLHEFEGVYHVLNGVLSPMDGVGPDDIRIAELKDRIRDEGITEVILATNPDVNGETTASYIARILRPLNIRCTRLAHGMPIGGDLEYTDEITLVKALEGRREM